jgi:predicted Zn finger-like uncharacterized protein
MYSQCPDCLARFRVTADRLRAARGRARCGRCGRAFDMLDRLSDELPVASTVASEASATLEPAAPPVMDALTEADTELADAARAELTVGAGHSGEEYHFSAEDVEKVFIDARDWQRQYGTRAASAGASDLAVADASQLVVDEPQGIEDITLEGLKVDIASGTGESTHLEAEFDYVEDEYGREDAVEPPSDTDLEQEVEEVELDSTSRLRTLDQVPDLAYPVDSDEVRPATDDERQFYQALIERRDLPVAAPASALARGTVAAARAPTAMRSAQRTSPTGRRADIRPPRSGDDELPDFDLAIDEAATRGPGSRWLAFGSVLLALTLAAQLTHHFRHDIARHPQAGPALRRLYALIGEPLSPNWDLDAFEIKQWGPTQDVAPRSALVVRAGLTNRADHAQPYPLLRLEFEDRFGAGVARRDFTPGEYLKSAAQAARQLAAGETTEAELSVVAPGADAVGYRLDVCLREDAGGVRCAHAE